VRTSWSMSNGSTIRGNRHRSGPRLPVSRSRNNNTVDMNVVTAPPGVGVYNDRHRQCVHLQPHHQQQRWVLFRQLFECGHAEHGQTTTRSSTTASVWTPARSGRLPHRCDRQLVGLPRRSREPRCDTVTAQRRCVLAAAAPPACVSCSSDGDCDEHAGMQRQRGPAITGTSMCEAGTPVVCTDQCETGTCLEPTGTCEPEPNGTMLQPPACVLGARYLSERCLHARVRRVETVTAHGLRRRRQLPLPLQLWVGGPRRRRHRATSAMTMTAR